MRNVNRIIALILAFVLTFSSIPGMAFQAQAAEVVALNAEPQTVVPTIRVEYAWGQPGNTVDVNVTIENNPGINTAELFVNYDSALELVGLRSGEAFSRLAMTKPGKLEPGCKVVWDGTDPAYGNGRILTMTFLITEDAVPGSLLPVTVTKDVVYDSNFDEIDEVNVMSDFINVIDYIPGDVNDDGVIDTADVILLRRYVVGGYGVSINTSAANINEDERVNSADIGLIRRYLAGGYGVVLKPIPVKCDHSLTGTEAKDATCTEPGNIAYWHCSKCDQYFSDAQGNTAIPADITIEALGHQEVIDEGYPPKNGQPGKTEGKHCSRCGEVLVPQEEYWYDQYEIRYNLYDNDTYLQKVGVENPNPAVYTSEDGLKLLNLESPGYIFEGWFDGQGSTAEQVKEIPVGSKETIYLYARWTAVEYTINFESPIDTIEPVKYYVNTGTTLENPEWYGYTFTGWSDDEGKIVNNTIPQGTVGNFTLHANWTSKRYQTIPVKELSNPLFFEDEVLDQYMWIYEIGRIENVPLYTIKDFGYVTGKGITWSETEEFSEQITSEFGKELAQAVTESTTRSSAWTLSQGWNQTTDISEDYSHEVSEEVNVEEKQSMESTGSWNIGSVKGGSHTTSNETGVSAKVGYEVSASSKVSGTIGVADAEAEVGYSVNGEVGGEYKETEENSKNWSVSKGYSAGYAASTETSSSYGISSTVSSNLHYGQSYGTQEEWEQSSAVESSDTKSREYTSSFNYVTGNTKTTTRTYTNEGAVDGFYRLVAAGTIHVFVVVGYDIATRCYYTYTYSVMDDKISDFMDYSANTSEYNDLQNGVLPFAVPYEVDQFVNSKIVATKGLEIDISTGVITGYNGNATHVMVPEYVVQTNDAGTTTVTKVTGISASAFAGKTHIVEVKLPDTITEIPAGAFAGCTSLTNVIANSVTKIQSNAFKDCSALDNYTVTTQVELLGQNVFDGAGEVIVKAKNASVAKAAVTCNAKSLTLYLENMTDDLSGFDIVIPGSTDYFVFNGGGRTYNGVRILSDATTTVIGDAVLGGCSDTPLVLSSENVTLETLTVNASGLAMQLTGDPVNMKLYSNVYMNSQGPNAVLTNNITISQKDGVYSRLHIKGDMLICGDEIDESLIVQTNGRVRYCESGSFFVNFNANGGVVGETSRITACGAPIGTLPVPTRDYHNFLGWYTAAEGGELVTENTVVAAPVDMTLYAHWELKPVQGWVRASEMPAGAQVVQQKWSYTQRETTTSTSTSLSGYTRIGKEWVQNGSGSKHYASFPGGFNQSHSYYTSFMKSAYTASESETSKRTVSNSWTGYIYWHWMYDCGSYANNDDRMISPNSGYWSADGTSGKGYNFKYFYAIASSVDCPDWGTGFCCSQNMRSYGCHSILPSSAAEKNNLHIGTPRMFRFNYYTSTYTDYYALFTYERYVDKESNTKVTAGGSISNVQEWVMYREK